MSHRLGINPDVLPGKPVIRGTCVTAELLLRKLAEGATIPDLLDAYPRLTRMMSEQRWITQRAPLPAKPL